MVILCANYSTPSLHIAVPHKLSERRRGAVSSVICLAGRGSLGLWWLGRFWAGGPTRLEQGLQAVQRPYVALPYGFFQ
jgi:hypothetical protein